MRKELKALVDAIEGNGSLADALAKAKAALAPKPQRGTITVNAEREGEPVTVQCCQITANFAAQGACSFEDFGGWNRKTDIIHIPTGKTMGLAGRWKRDNAVEFCEYLETVGDFGFSTENMWAGWSTDDKRHVAEICRSARYELKLKKTMVR